MAQFKVNGILPIVPTPFTEEGGIDLKGLASLLSFATQAGVCGVCLPAYASEFYKLTDTERHDVVCESISILAGRLPVVAQVNHVSSTHVAKSAKDLEDAGASAISVAVPRVFGLPERDLLRYFDCILSAITVPLVIQDFNPGGTTVSVDFAKSLHRQHPHFQYLKLEEPMMAARVSAIRNETHGDVGVIDGWGGVYMLELIPAGICGVMPGLAVSDILQMVWDSAQKGDLDTAYELFQGILPQITYSLQSMEFFHHAEKALLKARGVEIETEVRDATLTVHEIDQAHIGFLNRKVLELAQRRVKSYQL